MTLNLKSLTLRQEIALALSLKAIVLFVLWAAFFSGVPEKPIDARQAAAHVFSQHSPKEPNHDADRRAR